MLKTVTIPQPKALAGERELVLIPRREYERLLHVKSRTIPEVRLTSSQQRAIRASERELARGSYLTLSELRYALGSTYSKTRR